MQQVLILFFSFILPLFGLNQKIVKPKICINCKHFISDDNNGSFGKCSLFPQKIDNIDFLVRGIEKEEIVHYSYCSTARIYDHMCGKEGKMYKKRNLKK